MSAGRGVSVKVRASDAERAEWHAKARSAGLTLSDLVRRPVGLRTWTVAHAEVDSSRSLHIIRSNRQCRWATLPASPTKRNVNSLPRSHSVRLAGLP